MPTDNPKNSPVSILTRPEGRVQPHWQNVVSSNIAVSILTRPEGRVQPYLVPYALGVNLFQSSPVPKDGCNMILGLLSDTPRRFQSSPVPKDGCNHIPTADAGQLSSFNPHPSRRTGATIGAHGVAGFCRRFNPHPSRRTGATPPACWMTGNREFQSSPVPKDGCNKIADHANDEGIAVSILTRPEGRVQPSSLVCHSSQSWFQSSPVPKDGCNYLG